MKKTLLLQTALVAAVGLFVADFASAQTVKAEPIGVTVGGYMNRGVRFNNFEDGKTGQTDVRSTGMFGDSEVWFNIRAVLDNGLRVGGRIELEGQSEGDQIDESYMFMEHDNVGRMELGSTDRVATKMIYGAPTAIPNLNTVVFSTEANPIVTPTGNSALGPLMRFRSGSDDAEGINLYTARYFGSKAGKGLQVGFSWAPDNCQDSAATASGGSENACLANISSIDANGTVAAPRYANQRQVAANYLESFGSVDLALYGAVQRFDLENTGTAATSLNAKNLGGWTLGTALTYNVGDGSTVSLGGGYKKEDIAENKNAAAGTLGTQDRNAWNIGLRYLTNGAAAGSIGLGVEYFAAKADNGIGDSREDKSSWVSLGLTYQLAPGILTYAGVGQYQFEDGTGAAALDTKTEFGIVGVNLTF
ncbi:MAG: porin [Ferrovibrio sp.]|uniref:porin n=1 Tax=Ferrovibrio sp. TaxID=1917215 RepID=UPI00391D0508